MSLPFVLVVAGPSGLHAVSPPAGSLPHPVSVRCHCLARRFAHRSWASCAVVCAASAVSRQAGRRLHWRYGRQHVKASGRRACAVEESSASDAAAEGAGASADVVPLLSWPDSSGPFAGLDGFGWSWNCSWSLEENLGSLVLATQLNCIKFSGYVGGHCSAVLVRSQGDDATATEPTSADRCMHLEVVALAVNVPPAEKAFFSRKKTTKAGRSKSGGRRNEIHAEMDIVAKCARKGISLKGCWMCIAKVPCWECCKALVAAGVERIIFLHPGQVEDGEALDLDARARRSRFAAEAAGVEWTALPRCREREEYVAKLWDEYKTSRGLDRQAVKAMASGAQ
eukprot:TRINITY_DN50792_c0_g1_i1.p1 TRINITY_DN50792_c0_g1~~TRINITY_DN50792_c0_g1_i1.p1  ORF type:complete len:339 (-),score=43.33 TRINITY_DN50792_c0_g1_i1:124-1140(-)